MFAQTKGVNVTSDRLITAATQQRNATLSLLAKGLPIFEVDLRTKTPQVSYKGRVQAPQRVK